MKCTKLLRLRLQQCTLGGNDLTIEAAMPTATIPRIAMATAAFLLLAFYRMKRAEAGGIKKVQQPIMDPKSKKFLKSPSSTPLPKIGSALDGPI